MCQLLTRLDRLCILVSTMRFRGDPRRTSEPWSREALASTVLAVLWTCSPGLARTRPRIVGTQANRTAEQVLRSLVSTPLGRAAPPNPWQVILIEDRRVNAYANGAGWLTVTSGLAALLGNDRGAWAAVLGHEIGHFVIYARLSAYLPGFQRELEKAYLEARASSGNGKSVVPSALLLVPMGGGLSNRKLLREREYEADRVGLLMMAQAGYHPDFAVALERQLRARLGDQPKLELRSSHPRWTAREESTNGVMDAALAIFDSLWPDPARSPGGPPPPLGNIGPVTARLSADERSLALRVPVSVRNAADKQVRVEVIFFEQGGSDKRRRIQTTVPEYRSADGSLVLNAVVPKPSSAPSEVLLSVPVAAFATTNRDLKAVVFLLAGEQVLDTYFEPVQLSLSSTP